MALSWCTARYPILLGFVESVHVENVRFVVIKLILTVEGALRSWFVRL